MSQTLSGIPLSEVRLALLSQLRSADEFDAFCVEKFAAIHARFTAAMNREQRVSLLLGEAGADAVWRALRGNTHQQQALNAKNPYRGLLAFEIEHADQLLGRRAVLAEVRERIQGLLRSEPARRMLPLIGALGCGKTSFLRAGLLASFLQTTPSGKAPPAQNERSGDKRSDPPKESGRGPTDDLPQVSRKHIVVSAPGERPLVSLAAALSRSSGGSLSSDAVYELLRQPGGLITACQRIGGSEASPLTLIAIDQFEELFTMCRSPKEASQLASRLLEAATGSQPIFVILVIRSDFAESLSQFPELARLCAAESYTLPMLDRAQLAEIIASPAQRAGHRLAPEFIEELVQKTAGLPHGLPLLQFTLYRLWVDLASGRDGLVALRHVGGIEGALSDWANSLYKALEDDSERVRAQRLFLRLLRPSEGGHGVARRKRPLTELIPAGHDESGTRALVLHFSRAFEKLQPAGLLQITEDDEVTLAHDVIPKSWGMLSTWLKNDLEQVQFLARLDVAIDRYREDRRASRWLWQKRDLDKLRALRAASEPVLNREQEEFLAACEAFERRELAERLSERSMQSSRRGWLLVALLIACVATVMGLLVFVVSFDRARQAKHLAQSSSAAALAGQPGQGISALLLAMEATADSRELGPTWEGLYQVSMVLLPSRLLGQLDAATVPDAATIQAQANIRAIAFSPDGNHLLSGMQDGTLAIWDLRRPPNLGDKAGSKTAPPNPRTLTVRKHDKPLNFVSYARQGDVILSAGDDRVANLWDSNTEAALTTITWPQSEKSDEGTGDAKAPIKKESDRGILSLDLSPDGSTLITAGQDHVVRVYDVEERKLLLSLPHKDPVFSARYSPSGHRIVTACRDQLVRIFDAETGVLLRAIGPSQASDALREAKALAKQSDGHRGEVRVAVFSQDGQRLFTAGEDNSVILWDPETGQKIRTLLGHAGPITSIDESPDRRQILTASEDNTARIWDVQTGQPLLSLEAHTDRLLTAIYSPDGDSIATLSQDGTVRLWQPKRRPHIRIGAHNDWVRSAVFSPVPGQRLVLSASADGTGRIWDLQSGLLRLELRGHPEWVNSAAYSRDGRFIVTASMDHTARVWNADSGRLLATLTGHKDWIRSAAFSPNGEMIVTASKDKTARIWSGPQWGSSTALIGHEGAVTSAVFSADGREVLTASEDQTSRRFRVSDGAELGRLAGHGDWVRHAVYSQDGKRILTASRDRTAVVWDLIPTGATSPLGNPVLRESRALTLRGHVGWVRHAVYSQDDSKIITAGADMTARLWDARTGAQLLVLTGHSGPVSTGEFSPDGRYAVTAGRDGQVLVHAFDPDTLRRYGCDILRSLYHHPDADPTEIEHLLRRCQSLP